MQILKIITFIFCVLQFNTIIAQVDNRVSTAFSESYALEINYNYDEAIKKLETLKLDVYEVNLRLGWLFYINKNYTKSLIHYKKASDQMPLAVEPLLGIAYPLSVNSQWDDLIQVYLKILQIDSKNSIVNYRMGLIYYYKKDYIKAEKYFNVTLQLYPFDYDCTLMSAWNKYFLAKFDDAKTLFKRVLLIYPSDTSALEGLGYIK